MPGTPLLGAYVSAARRTGGLYGAMKTVITFFLAGFIAELAFEIYAFILSPLLFDLTLQPAGLVATLAERWLGVAMSMNVAFVIHAVAGIILFPLTYLAFARISLVTSPWANGLFWGLVLWVVAQGVLAPLAGRAPFMGFGSYTFSSLVAHPLMTVAFALAHRTLSIRLTGLPAVEVR